MKRSKVPLQPLQYLIALTGPSHSLESLVVGQLQINMKVEERWHFGKLFILKLIGL